MTNEDGGCGTVMADQTIRSSHGSMMAQSQRHSHGQPDDTGCHDMVKVVVCGQTQDTISLSMNHYWEELLSLSPEVRELVRQATSAKRVPTEQPRDNPVLTMFLGEVLPFLTAGEDKEAVTDIFAAKLSQTLSLPLLFAPLAIYFHLFPFLG